MKTVLLVGLGSFGENIAKKLYSMRHEIMAIDNDEEHINDIMPYVTNAEIGDSTNKAFLESLGISNFDLCVVTIGDNFQDSLETTSLLKELGAKLVVARASNDVHAKFLLRNGADHVVYPEKQMAEWTAARFSSELILDYIAVDSENAIYEVKPLEQWIGKSIIEINIRQKYKVNVICIKENKKINAGFDPHEPITENQTLLVIGNDKDIRNCFKM